MPAPRAPKRASPQAATPTPPPPKPILPNATDLAQIPLLFAASQHSVATHRKNINALHAVFLRAAALTALSDDGKSIRLTGEKGFGEAFRSAVVYPLGVKKGVEQADRIVKFVAGFVGFAVEFDAKQRAGKHAEQGGEDSDNEDDGPASRLVSQLLAFLLKGFQAKNKIARFRCVQLVALMVNSLGEIDDDSYKHLKNALLDRVQDKEATVRMQAVVALSKLQDADDAEESDDDDSDQEEQSVAEVLIDVLTHDPAAEVRRAALFNLIPSPVTLPSLILRTLDVDPINRRASFTHVLFEVPCASLTQEQREEAIGRGLRDREEGVKKAAKKLVAKWAEETGGIVEFLALFDVYEGKVAEKVLEAVFETKPELVEDLDFGDDFYASLTPQTAFIARVYFNHLRAVDDPRLADLEPVVTALAFFIQAEWTKLVVMLESEERDVNREEEAEFVVGELVGMAVNVDYGDEIGRRKMFELMREMLSHSLLPPLLIPKCLDVLLKGTSERDFMRIVVEIVQSLRADSSLVTSESEGEEDDASEMGTQAGDNDDGEDEEQGHGVVHAKLGKGKGKARMPSKGPAHLERRKELDLRCLFVVRALLERVMGALQENSMLHGLVAELIVPSVKTKDPEIRAEGLICLGLCCLLDKARRRRASMALDSFELLARQSQATDGALQVKILQTLFDLLVLHGINFGTERKFGPDVILSFLLNCLEQEEPEVAATAVVGVAKLMLSGMVTDEEILNRLVLLYFASETADNQELRQCLSYFLPVYCYSNPQNQRRVANVSLAALSVLKGVYDDLGDKGAMVAPLQIGLQLVDWTDPQKAVQTEHVKDDLLIHVDLAMQMVKLLYTEQQKDERKLLCQLLPKLYIPDEVDDLKIKSLLTLVASLKLNRPLADAVSKNALLRFEKALVKNFGERLEALTQEEIHEAEEMKAARDWLEAQREEGDEDPEEGDQEEEEDEEASEEEDAGKEQEGHHLKVDADDGPAEEEEEDAEEE